MPGASSVVPTVLVLAVVGLAMVQSAATTDNNNSNNLQKRFYSWDAPAEAPNPEKRFYSWESQQPQISAKERAFVKQFLQNRGGADWLRNHKMFAQYSNNMAFLE